VIKLHNTLTRQIEEFIPLASGVAIYSCGPTVYDHAHIGNLSSFIVADLLRRVLTGNDNQVTHVMNFTDVDDKTIHRSREQYKDKDPMEALQTLTKTYSDVFLQDMQAVGNDTSAMTFIRATDPKVIDGMQQLITELHDKGFAYVADDGVYFSIEAYKKSGKIYGQLSEISASSTSTARIQNDEYDKESAHDFALWKVQKDDEPAWKFHLAGHKLDGRPGWHIECSVMSAQTVGQPFDIHTGGIDLIFPHHENEIAQSTAGKNSSTYARFFVHSEHILVDGKKMAKSANNFFTLKDIIDKKYDPLVFRMLILQGHYRNQVNFTWTSLDGATSRLDHWRAIAALRHQTYDTIIDDNDKDSDENGISLLATSGAVLEALNNDLDTPEVLKIIDEAFSRLESHRLSRIDQDAFLQLLTRIDELLGLRLLDSTPDISDEAKQIIIARQRAREDKDWAESDRLRDQLIQMGIVVRDTAFGPVWAHSKQA
jgi:cysteinyl-tRNA synthetase